MLVLPFYKTHYAVIYIRINETPAFILYVSFFSILFYLASLFWNKETTSRNALIFRDFIIRILTSCLASAYIYGNAPVVQGLIVANHRSYFDPIIMLNHRQTFPVGKRKSNHGRS
jgi:1-acyl-sn-glycerol-3-phosphate acyltransferase